MIIYYIYRQFKMKLRKTLIKLNGHESLTKQLDYSTYVYQNWHSIHSVYL